MSAREPDHIDHWMKAMSKHMKETVTPGKWNAEWTPERDRKREKKNKRCVRA